MAKGEKCKRCGDPAETIDNVRGTTFWGLIQRKTVTTVESFIRVAGTQFTRTGGPRDGVIRTEDEIRLCDPCWGLVVLFLQGRAIVGVDHEHVWQKSGKAFDGIYLDICPLCYKSRVHQEPV